MTITLVMGSDPVRGDVLLADGERQEFWGWLELAEVIQRVAEGGSEAGDVSWGPETSTGSGSRY